MSPQSSSWLSRPDLLIKQGVKIAFKRYRALKPLGKAVIWASVVFYIALTTFFIVVTPSRIFQWLYDLAHNLSKLPYGWLALGGIILMVSFPPFIGHTTAVTLCGFAYGMKGFPLAAAASSLGSALVFITFRFLFSERLKRWSSANTKWQALESVIRAKGLGLIILIRLSPFPPWVWSNVLFSSIEAVALWQFIVATFFIYPKLLLHIFIGSRAAALADGEQRSHMDTQTKVMNAAFIVAGILVGATSSWFVYRAMQKHIRELEGLPEETDRLAADALEDIEEGAPLLRDFSP
ncbi:Golgi apparatus membrane protein TVP38 [Athelia psychrophila]|uniref:Golgi apparatus membrane protein TVP38 n=1 Tax=Athelia psychrophila TaxID=1759441 RepID=A0A166VLP5_9AGAM|nr:Golgi apparatus membrane protein TVP38 [Fibularhizoctonia sp. CBS 109695]